MIDIDLVKIDDKQLEMALLLYHDGPKEYISVFENILLVYNEDKEDGDEWLMLSPNTGKLSLFLQNHLTLREMLLCEQTAVYLLVDTMEPDMTFKVVRDLNRSQIENRKFVPTEDSYLGEDIHKRFGAEVPKVLCGRPYSVKGQF